MKTESLKNAIGGALSVITPNTDGAKNSVKKILQAIDRDGTTLTVSDQLSQYEAQIEALDKLSIIELYTELDEAMLDSIQEMRHILTDPAQEPETRISAVRALGTVGSYVNKRKESTTSSGGGGNHINVVIDNSSMEAPRSGLPIVDFDNE